MRQAYIYDAVRTPRGRGNAKGSLHEVTVISLATQVLQALRDRSSLDTRLIADVIVATSLLEVLVATLLTQYRLKK